ncbi:putative glutathione S-transferase 1 [[Candida] jaroonii]|uniref:Glutathione S-transferase 1 n=1 Tax=[Candida] jaroonii TaxID=467808 RepID=A0ACA9YCU3_9ASCO|nr:putative glutathione S-transferase 1 [[Candida] jaroonii]
MSIRTFIANSPNGYKLSIYLELLGLKHETTSISLHDNEQKQEWFLKLNPNGRIPTLVDESTNTTISESAAILMYLADTYDKERKFSYLHGTKEYNKMLELIFFQMSGIGPMQGQANWFLVYAPEKIPYAIERYTNETKRLYSVLEEVLKRNNEEYGSDFLVGPHISIPDILFIGWIPFLPLLGIKLSAYPRVFKWASKVLEIPQVKKGFTIPANPPIWDDSLPSYN